MADFIPNARAKFTDWVRLQLRKRALHATTLGWSAADVARMDAEDNAILKAHADEEDAHKLADKLTTARQDATKTYEQTRRPDIARAKTHAAYSDAIGREFEWSALDSDEDRDELKPTLKISKSADGWKLDWSKNGQDGVKVFRRKTGEAQWTYLATDMRAPYIDTEAGLSGEYEYYVQLLKDDQRVGQPSDIVTATHGGR